MEISFVFHDREGKQLVFDDDFADMADSISLKTLPRIGETVLIDTGLGLEEFLHLDRNEKTYLEEFIIQNYEGRGGQYRFAVMDVVHFTAGNYGAIYLKPRD